MRLNSFLLVFALVHYSAVFGQPKSELAQKIHSYIGKHFPANEPGCVVLVAKGDEIILRKAYGLADLKSKTQNTPETVFRIGSISKQFTSTAILKLVSERKISLQDPITKFLPAYPMADKPITISHLLTHTSGIKSYTSLPEIVGSKESKERAYTVEEMIDAFKAEPKDFAPGDDYRYNNSGYFLLGAIIEKVSGMSWSDYLTENFFEPLDMKSTYCNDLEVTGKSKGYYKNRKSYTEADVVHPSASYAAGAIVSTVDDLWKWNKAVISGKVLPIDLLDIAWRPVELNNGVTKPYGFGWEVKEKQGKRSIGHAGTIDGFQSFVWYVPDSEIFVAILSNNMDANPEENCREILKMLK